MNPRQRFIEAITFGKPDKVPFQPGGPRESTIARWRREGLPEDKHYMQAIYEILNIEPPSHQPSIYPGVSFRMIPTFEEKVLEHKDGHYIVQDWMGAITEISDRYDYTYIRSPKDFVTRKWHKFPVENHKDWDEMKKRFKADSPGRFPEDFKERCLKLGDRDYPMTISFNGPFWQMREWCGMEGLCILMIEQPDFVEEMANFWGDFVSDVLDQMLPFFCPDSVMVSEDMAYKSHSMISPKMIYKFLMPCYQKWVPKLKKAGCPVIDVDSDGYIAELIPIWIEAGFNCCNPIEVAAGNDIVEYRRQFGKKMAFHGGIDKRAIAKGGQTLEDEVLRVVPPLLEDGGFIPGCDHGVPHDISWQNFIEYSRILAKLTGWL